MNIENVCHKVEPWQSFAYENRYLEKGAKSHYLGKFYEIDFLLQLAYLKGWEERHAQCAPFSSQMLPTLQTFECHTRMVKRVQLF